MRVLLRRPVVKVTAGLLLLEKRSNKVTDVNEAAQSRWPFLTRRRIVLPTVMALLLVLALIVIYFLFEMVKEDLRVPRGFSEIIVLLFAGAFAAAGWSLVLARRYRSREAMGCFILAGVTCAVLIVAYVCNSMLMSLLMA
jgi:hypothetical protein